MNDWAKDHHGIVLVDAQGKVLTQVPCHVAAVSGGRRDLSLVMIQ